MRAHAWMLLLLLGCSSGRETPAAAISGEGLTGSFNLSLIAPSDSDPAGHTAFLGKVYDGPSPARTVWELAAEEGDCQLRTPRTPFCNEPCGGSAVCVEDDTCEPYPAARTVGEVRVQGVETSAGAHEFAMQPIASAYQPTGGTKLPFASFAAGDELKLVAAGGDYVGFTIRATGIAPLEIESTELVLERDRPLPLRWEASSEDSRVQLKLDISHHGGTKGMIECDVPDTGSAQLSAALVTQLLELGVAGFPTVILTRVSTGHADEIAFSIDSKVERSVTIAGLLSCTSNADCGFEKTCQADLTCSSVQ